MRPQDIQITGERTAVLRSQISLGVWGGAPLQSCLQLLCRNVLEKTELLVQTGCGSEGLSSAAILRSGPRAKDCMRHFDSSADELLARSSTSGASVRSVGTHLSCQDFPSRTQSVVGQSD